MRKRLVTIMVSSLVGVVQGMDKIVFLEDNAAVDSFSVTPTNLVIQFNSEAPFWNLDADAEVVLTLDKEVVFGDGHHADVIFTPVSFKNKLKGFRITDTFFWYGVRSTNAVMYIALSDEPVDVGEEDLEMVMEGRWWNGEYIVEGWKAYESAPANNAEETAEAEGTPAAIPEAQQRHEAVRGKTEPPAEEEPPAPVVPAEAKQTRHWLYAAIGILAAFGVTLYFTRKKKGEKSAQSA